MLYVFKDGITTDGKYVRGARATGASRAYDYVSLLSHAKLFKSVTEAIGWLERTAFENGEKEICYNGCLRLMRVESVPIQFKEIGLVE